MRESNRGGQLHFRWKRSFNQLISMVIQPGKEQRLGTTYESAKKWQKQPGLQGAYDLVEEIQ